MASPLRFVVLAHEGIDDPHFDLMFEIEKGGMLATWRAKSWPLKSDDVPVRIGDHRPDYLIYEGEISGNRGTVRRVADGTYRRHENAEHWIVEFIEPSLASIQLPTAT